MGDLSARTSNLPDFIAMYVCMYVCVCLQSAQFFEMHMGPRPQMQ